MAEHVYQVMDVSVNLDLLVMDVTHYCQVVVPLQRA
jgi:hypothetical protein